MKSISVFRLYRLPLELSSWFVFIISLIIYWITADPGVSYWDCPEYVTAASRLEIGHPPGNPIWMLAMRVVTIPFPAEYHAYVINLCSGVFMAFASFFICRLIFIPVRLFLQNSGDGKDNKSFYNYISGIISAGGSLCYSFCDSAWFSAVEAEVYAMSAMLTALSLWLMMMWWFEKSISRRIRLLILLAYIIGLSIGVHQLNLLCIPVFILIYIYKKNPSRLNPILVLAWIALGCGIIAFILLMLMPGTLYLAQVFELFFINKLSAQFDTGVLIFLSMLLVILILSIYYTSKKRLRKLIAVFWMLAFILLGYSSFGFILIRSKAHPFMNEGVPSDIFSLTSYINRDQYPSSPLIYGETPYSKPMYQESFDGDKAVYSKYALKKGKPLYEKSLPGAVVSPRSRFLTEADSSENSKILRRDQDGYILSDYSFKQVLTPELNMWFPRMTSLKPADRTSYADWAGFTEETKNRVSISEAFDSLGNPVSKIKADGAKGNAYSYKPTYFQQLRYFLSYQAFYMYFRYLLWNFMGRQNDYHSKGEIEHGNFITGYDFIDRNMVGNLDNIPQEIWKENPGHNNYYSIPFILGIIGVGWLAYKSRKSRRINSVIFLFFLMTGLAIVFYLNQSPGEPRERDYSFLGSYMAFAMWIAAGLTFIIKLFLKSKRAYLSSTIATILAFVPSTLMAVVNFDDHDRQGRFETAFYASSFLDFEMPAVIFSHGDNSTFPLWYSHEVLNKGREHTPIDVTYLSLPSYVVNLKRQGNKGLCTLAETSQIVYGAFQLTRIPHDSISYPLPLKDVLDSLYSSKKQPPVFITSLVEFPGNNGDTITINLHDLSRGSSYLSFRHLMLLDILASQKGSDHPKALFFPANIDYNFYKPIEPLLLPVFYGKILLPESNDSLAVGILKQSIERELNKIDDLQIKPHYSEMVIADMSRRYRGELIKGAWSLMGENDTIIPKRVISVIEEKFPYSELSPGTFTETDTTYYEGKEYLHLLNKLFLETGNTKYKILAEKQNLLLEKRKQEWLKYYNSLSPQHRKALSPRSIRNLL